MIDRPLRTIRSFARRQNRKTPAQQRALDTLMPVYGLPMEEGLLDFATVFGQPNEVVLEVGFGMGESLAEMARQCPEKNFIGVEVYSPGIGRLLQLIEEHQLKNIRIFQGDILEIFPKRIPDKSLTTVQVFFPDPWPKRRHHKRRLIQAEFIQFVKRKLRPSGILHVATDWEDYARQIEQLMGKEKEFEILDPEGGESSLLHRLTTKFESRGKQLQHEIHDLAWRLTPTISA